MKRFIIVVFAVILLFAYGCSPSVPVAEQTVSPSSTPQPEATPTPKPTPVATPEPTPSPTPDPTPTPEPIVIPLEFTSLKLDTDIIGTPEIRLKIKNNGTETIDALNFYAESYDAYGEIVKQYETYDMVSCTYQDGDISPRDQTKTVAWDLFGISTAKTVKIAIYKYHIKDGETIEIPESQLVWIAIE